MPVFFSHNYILHMQYTWCSSLTAFLHFPPCSKTPFYFRWHQLNWQNYVQKPCWSAPLNSADPKYPVTVTTVLGQRSVCSYSECKLIIKLQSLEFLQLASSLRKKSTCQNLVPFENCYGSSVSQDFS